MTPRAADPVDAALAHRAVREAVHRRRGYDGARAAAFVVRRARPLKGRILELGTGQGRFLAALLREALRVTSVDVDAEAQALTRRILARAGLPGRPRYVTADARRLPWRDRSFDLVVSMNALHHMRGVPRVIREILRVVRPGGRIVLADFNDRGFDIFDRIHRSEGRTHERRPYTFEGIAALLEARGWRVAFHDSATQRVLVATRQLS
jgi:ubiquinone/menaquinone biosynthesis C-methylase UbiE